MTDHLADTITIQDDDGFTTHWPFPTGSSLLHQVDYIELCQRLHHNMATDHLITKATT